MDDNLTKQLLEQLNSIAVAYRELGTTSKYDDLSDLGDDTALKFITRSTAAIERATSRDSVYSRQVQEILGRTNDHDFGKLKKLIGVVDSLSADLEAGYLASVSELIHGELFGDFLEMSLHLLEEGYKDPAAVVAGAALESHLRQLGARSGIPVQIDAPTGIRPKKADLLNAELGNAKTISKLDQKNVTAWLDLRNKAAHGQYSEYSREQVSLMVAAIQNFITRNPA